jgi:hypothetical protein
MHRLTGRKRPIFTLRLSSNGVKLLRGHYPRTTVDLGYKVEQSTRYVIEPRCG